MLSVWRARTATFTENLKKYKYYEIVNLPSPEEIAAGRVFAESPDLFGGAAALLYTPQEYKSHLENIVRLLESFPNFNFYISHRGSLKNVRLAAKDEVGVIVAKTDPPPAVFAFNHQNMTNAFYCYLEEVISRIPQGARDRRQVVKSLLELAGKLAD